MRPHLNAAAVLLVTHVLAFLAGAFLWPDPEVEVFDLVEVTHDEQPVEIDPVDHEARAKELAEQLAKLEAEAEAELEEVRAAYDALRNRQGPVDPREFEWLEARLEALRNRL